MKDGLVTVLDVRTEDEFAADHLPRPATAVRRRGACARIRREVAVQPLPGQCGPSFVSPSVCASVIVRLVIEGDAERSVSRGYGGSIFQNATHIAGILVADWIMQIATTGLAERPVSRRCMMCWWLGDGRREHHFRRQGSTPRIHAEGT
jgi:rhodanese-related sulfurtransferase